MAVLQGHHVGVQVGAVAVRDQVVRRNRLDRDRKRCAEHARVADAIVRRGARLRLTVTCRACLPARARVRRRGTCPEPVAASTRKGGAPGRVAYTACGGCGTAVRAIRARVRRGRGRWRRRRRVRWRNCGSMGGRRRHRRALVGLLWRLVRPALEVPICAAAAVRLAIDDRAFLGIALATHRLVALVRTVPPGVRRWRRRGRGGG